MKKSILKTSEIIKLIENGERFEAITEDYGLEINLQKYVPFVCTAIHNGSNIREELQDKILVDDFERWYEEDPLTADFIHSMPITLIANDSRFEYDLNRPPDECIYEKAWGKKIWKKPLSQGEKNKSLRKHKNYYKILSALISKLEQLYESCIVYDIHSYNYKRWERETPLFNIGTENIEQKHENIIQNWLAELSKIKIKNIQNQSSRNDVFYGRGYNLKYITKNFKRTLVLATEIKKVYCNELSGDIYPDILREIQLQLKKAILNNTHFFSQTLDKWKHDSHAKLLDKNIQKSLLKTDQKLYQLLKNFELLAMVNPTNTLSEKKKFFKNKYTELPKFRYQPLKTHVFDLKQKILMLPFNQISDISIKNLYESILNSYFDKIDLIHTIGTKKFYYNSLRYFGRPSPNDIQNAEYILTLPTIPDEITKKPHINPKNTIHLFKSGFKRFGFEVKVELNNKVISKVLALNSKKRLLVNPHATFTEKEVNSLIEHEIGVHMLTTMNSNLQKLKIFNLGFPVNTETQEGLAILAEYLSGNFTLDRLKRLALRVVAVNALVNGADFVECFHLLRNKYHLDKDTAFTISTRVYRGGGFTKDYLYLSGFIKIYKFWKEQNDLTPLFIGKTSLNFYSVINEMIEREMILKPKYLNTIFTEEKTFKNHDLYDYILSGLK
jgi:uncharacterized protein (TIGR02421 family)